MPPTILENTILEIRQSLSLESTLTGLRTFLVTEKFLDMICKQFFEFIL